MSDDVLRLRYYMRQQREEIDRLRRALTYKKQRAAKPTSEPLPPLTHGRHSRYAKGCRCKPCTEAHREYTAKRRLERLLSGDLNHGTRHAYDCGCRCDPCVAARRASYQRESAAKRAQRGQAA